MSDPWDRAELTLGQLPQYDIQLQDGSWRVYPLLSDTPVATCASFEQAMGWVFGWWSRHCFGMAGNPNGHRDHFGVGASVRARRHVRVEHEGG